MTLNEEIEHIIGGNIKIEGTVEDIEEIRDSIIKIFEKWIDAELEKTLREYVGGLRPQLIESYYEGYREALKKLKKELVK